MMIIIANEYIYIYIKDRDGKNTFTCDLGRV
jgi:hypothetical protein